MPQKIKHRVKLAQTKHVVVDVVVVRVLVLVLALVDAVHILIFTVTC